MSGKIFKTITNFTKNYNDPENNLPFDENNTKIQIVEKNGNVNISLTINDKYLEQYNKIAELFKDIYNHALEDHRNLAKPAARRYHEQYLFTGRRSGLRRSRAPFDSVPT